MKIATQNLGRMQLISPKLHSKIGHLGEEAITKENKIVRTGKR